METYFSVSLNGQFVFRTDVFSNDAAGAFRAQQALWAGFGPFSGQAGYVIERNDRSAAWTSSPVGGPKAEAQPAKLTAAVALTELEQAVYEALYDCAQDNGGDFACAEEVNTKRLKITKQQFGALLTSLENKKVISVDITYVNGREKVTQVEAEAFRKPRQ